MRVKNVSLEKIVVFLIWFNTCWSLHISCVMCCYVFFNVITIILKYVFYK